MWKSFGNMKYFPYLCIQTTKIIGIERNRRQGEQHMA